MKLWAVLVLASPLFAQQYTQVSGLILDSSAAAVPGAMVTVVSEDTGFRRVSHSRENGVYAVGALQPGLYRITVRKDGFRTVVRLGVKLDVAVRARVDFSLPVGSVQESITVYGDPVTMNTEDSSVGTLVHRDWIDGLPLTGRGVLSLFDLSPGVVVTPATRGEAGQFTVNGQRPNTHYFTVDGLSVNTGVSGGDRPAESTGGTLPGMTAFGTFHQLITVDALDEFRIQTSTLAPEYGRLPGAQVSLSSRAGSNQFHGSVFGFLRNEKLDANDWFANSLHLEEAPSRFQDFGATLGGPIRRNRVFFFGSYENLHLRQPLVWRGVVPSLTARQNAPDWASPLLNLYPAPTGSAFGGTMAEWAGFGDRPSSLQSASLRLDAALSSRVTIFARANDVPSRTEFGNTQVNYLSLHSSALAGGLNAVIGSGVVEDLRASVSDARGHSDWRLANPVPPCYLASVPFQVAGVNVPCDSFFQFSISGMGQLLSGRESETRQRQWNIVETLAVSRSSHLLRFGADYRRITPYHSNPSELVTILADSLSDLLSRRQLWTTTTDPQAYRTLLNEISLFGQDTWHLTPRLALTYGMRWELNPSPISTRWINGLESTGGVFDPQGGVAIWKLRYTNLAPRFGLAWRLGDKSETVLRAGFGVYYNSSLGAATDLVNRQQSNMWEAGPGSSYSGSVKSILTFGFSRDLRLPVSRQWNVTLERTLAPGHVVTAGYVGAAGRYLLRREITGAPSTSLVRTALTTNHADSDYHALQLQYRVNLPRRVQALASYTWSHSIDNSSTDSAFHWAGSGYSSSLDRASSDFDVRHAFSLAFSYQLDARHDGSLPGRLYRGWTLDGIYRARSGFPIDILNAEHSMGVTFANVFRPDVVPGMPIWLSDPNAPGGRRLNPDAFLARTDLTQGNLGRNAITGFGMSQLDLAARRSFSLGERSSLELRIETFNLFNRANLADPVSYLANPLFGEPASMLNVMLSTGTPASGLAPMLQIGGPRSVQLGLRLLF